MLKKKDVEKLIDLFEEDKEKILDLESWGAYGEITPLDKLTERLNELIKRKKK